MDSVFSFIMGSVYVIYAIVCILLILIILMQASKGGGLAGAFGGGGETAFGAQAGSQFKKFTQVVAILFVLLVIYFNLVQKYHKNVDTGDANAQEPEAAASVDTGGDTNKNTVVPKKESTTPLAPVSKEPKKDSEKPGGVGEDRPN